MADTRERTLGEKLNTWVQIVGIIGAAAWGAYTFVYKEITLPKSAPINITTNLQLKKVGAGNRRNPLVAVEIRISAANPSSRPVYLLPNMWIVYGNKLTSPNYESAEAFNKLATTFMNVQRGDYLEKHTAKGLGSVVAVGSLFQDKWLNPSETASRTLIFYVPRHEYDVLDAYTSMPSTAVQGGVELEWTLDQEMSPHSTLYRVSAGRGRQHIEPDRPHGYSDQGIGFQYAYSQSQLSLWE